jgi:hypothetical protein
LIHWITSVLLSLLFFCLLQLFEHKALFRALDRAGSDAVMQVYGSSGDKGGQRVVVVDIGPEVTTALLAKVLEQIRGAKTKAVGLDFKIVADSREGSDGSDDAKKSEVPKIPIDDLLAVLGGKWGQTRVALPVVNPRLDVGTANLSWVRPATPDVERNEDGVVRTTRDHFCRESATGPVTIPTLAAAMVMDAPHSGHGCEPDEPTLIRFVPIWVPEQEPDPNKFEARVARGSDILLITKQFLMAHPKVLADSYVLLGQLEGDFFMTPVGKMPGVLIHALSARTLVKNVTTPRWLGVLLHKALDIFLGVLAGALFAALIVWFGREEPLKSDREAVLSFAFGLCGLVAIGGVLVFAGVVFTRLAAGLVEKGLLIGAVAAVFGAMLETLVHVGRYLIEPIEWLVSRLMGSRTVSMLLAMLFLSSGDGQG